MTYKDLKRKIKEEQKTLALQIRRGKFLRKPVNRKDITKEDKRLYYSIYSDPTHFATWRVEALGREFRHRHIIYCNMFNNTPISLIEQPRDDNSPDGKKLEKIKKEWEDQIDEALRNCA